MIAVRLYFDAWRLVVASGVWVGSSLRLVDYVAFDRPVADEVLAEAVAAAFELTVPDEFEGGDEASWDPVLDLFGVDGLELLACCGVRSRNGYVSVTAMKPGDDGFPVVAARGDASLVPVSDRVWLAYELRQALETAVSGAGERFGARGGLFDSAVTEVAKRSIIGAERSSVVTSRGRSEPLRWVLGSPAESAPQVTDHDFGVWLDEAAALGLWASLDAVELAASRESNVEHRSWRWGRLDESVRVALNLDAMLEDDLDRALIGRMRMQWSALGLDLVVEHGLEPDHTHVSWHGFRAWINGEAVSYGPLIDTIFAPLALVNWLADREGIDDRLYVSGVFNGWDSDSSGTDFQQVFLLPRLVAELIQATPVLKPSQRLVPVEELAGQVANWKIR